MAGGKATTAPTTATTTTTTTSSPPPSQGRPAPGEVDPEHEAALAGALALANLFNQCVVAFGLIHPSARWDKEEQLLLVRLGIQQARLLIWGDIAGVTSPPRSVTDRAVPKHPSASYPDLNEPTFFAPRDGRLDEPETRTVIENALTAIVDRPAHATREEMMDTYGLQPPKHVKAAYEPALDRNRLEAFRERYELLQEVAEDFAHLHAGRHGSIVGQTSWIIADKARFARFIGLVKDTVDRLIGLLDVKDRVDRAVRMDIRALGWHLANDRACIALDASKLRLIQEVCKDEYPEYVVASTQALQQIRRDRVESTGSTVLDPLGSSSPKAALPKSNNAIHANGNDERSKRIGLFKLLRSFGKSSQDTKGRRASTSDSAATSEDPGRSHSESGPTRSADADDMGGLEPVRSKSLGAILEPTDSMSPEDDELTRDELEKLHTQATARELPPEPTPLGRIIRHDQYRGIARTDSRDLVQPGVNYE